MLGGFQTTLSNALQRSPTCSQTSGDFALQSKHRGFYALRGLATTRIAMQGWPFCAWRSSKPERCACLDPAFGFELASKKRDRRLLGRGGQDFNGYVCSRGGNGNGGSRSSCSGTASLEKRSAANARKHHSHGTWRVESFHNWGKQNERNAKECTSSVIHLLLLGVHRLAQIECGVTCPTLFCQGFLFQAEPAPNRPGQG